MSSAAHRRPAGVERKGAVRCHHLGQPPGTCAAIQSIAAGSVEEAGRIGGPHPVELVAETRAVAEHRVGAVRHDEWVDPVAPVLADPQDGSALRSAQPFVAVAGPVGGAQRIDLGGDHPGDVGAIDEGVDPASRERRHHLARRGR